MARIDFAFGAEERLRTTCEVVRKHYQQRPLLVYSSQKSVLDQFDQLLWSFEADSFIPHVNVNDTLASCTPVLLTQTAPEPTMHPRSSEQKVWLINLDSACPPTAHQFERVLEIVSLQPNDIEPARQRWVQYKKEGHELHAHDISNRNST